jgi:hypothetical protein
MQENKHPQTTNHGFAKAMVLDIRSPWCMEQLKPTRNAHLHYTTQGGWWCAWLMAHETTPNAARAASSVHASAVPGYLDITPGAIHRFQKQPYNSV